MKKIGALLLFVCLITGCTSVSNEMERGLALRDKLLSCGCSFSTDITADYGDKVYTFTMDCLADAQGNITFTVTAPETISGITGTIDNAGGKLTFDDTALQFALMADDQVTPVSAPWILVKTLRSGYLTSANTEGDYLRLTIDDSYEEDALHLDIWLSSDDIPVRAEILYDGRKILSLAVTDFEIV